jgi:ribosomal protein L12E/L44/L45/RPP1/RPP2
MENTKNPRGSGRLPVYFDLLDERTTIEQDIILHLQSATGQMVSEERAREISAQLTSKNVFEILAKYKAIIDSEAVKKEDRPYAFRYDPAKRKQQYADKMARNGKTVTHRVKKQLRHQKFDSLELFMNGVKVFEAERGADLIRYIENYGEVTNKTTMHRAIKYGSTINKKFTVKKKLDDTNN